MVSKLVLKSCSVCGEIYTIRYRKDGYVDAYGNCPHIIVTTLDPEEIYRLVPESNSHLCLESASAAAREKNYLYQDPNDPLTRFAKVWITIILGIMLAVWLGNSLG